MNSQRAHLDRDFNEAGVLSERVNLDSFIGDDTFLSKDGSVGKVVALEGREPEGRTAAQLEADIKVVHGALRNLGTDMMVYTYLTKRSKPDIPCGSYDNPVVRKAERLRTEHLRAKVDQLYSVELHVALLRKSSAKSPAMRSKPSSLWTRLQRVFRAFSASAERNSRRKSGTRAGHSGVESEGGGLHRPARGYHTRHGSR